MNVFKLIKSNFSSGLVVFFVALPLCLGISLASGAPPLAGIISGIIGGIIVGGLSNSSISVSGPAAGLTAILVAGVIELGSFELVLMAGVIAGLIQIAFGFLKAGSISNYFPSNVIEGMLAGIGIIIVLKQIPYALGFTDLALEGEGLVSTIVTSPQYFVKSVLAQLHPGAVVITLVSVSVLVVWDKVAWLRKMKMIPAALVVVLIGIAMNALFRTIMPGWSIDNSMLVSLPEIKKPEDLSTLITFPAFSGFFNPKVWILGMTIALVASIETLLCVEAADKMDFKRRITDTNRELKAQGIGNLLSSLLGGLPMTSVVVRSSANAKAGATSKCSAIIHGVLLLVSVLAIPFLLNLIPLATLSAILIVVGYKLARPAVFVHFWHKGRLLFLPFIATMIGVVFTDLLMGVGIGMVISILYILLGNKKHAYQIRKIRAAEKNEVHIVLAEEVSFLNKADIKKALGCILPDSFVTIDASSSLYIAADVIVLIEEFANVTAKELQMEVKLIGFKTDYQEEDEEGFSFLTVRHHAMI